MNDQKISPATAIVGSIVHATYEVIFVLLPILVWAVILLSLDMPTQEIGRLPAIPFAALALFSSVLRDGMTALHQDTPKDSRERDLVVLISIIGVTISTVLLTLAVLLSKGHLPTLGSFYYAVTWPTFVGGVISLFLTKSILIQRKKYGRYT